MVQELGGIPYLVVEYANPCGCVQELNKKTYLLNTI